VGAASRKGCIPWHRRPRDVPLCRCRIKPGKELKDLINQSAGARDG
jgi:hypothetical protein